MLPANLSHTLLPFLLTVAGVAGSALIISAYFANQQGWLHAENRRYSLANLAGAVLILVSLITAWICLPPLLKASGRLLAFMVCSNMVAG
jgi:hypothetical protein